MLDPAIGAPDQVPPYPSFGKQPSPWRQRRHWRQGLCIFLSGLLFRFIYRNNCLHCLQPPVLPATWHSLSSQALHLPFFWLATSQAFPSNREAHEG
jgi:hypothetical protein